MSKTATFEPISSDLQHTIALYIQKNALNDIKPLDAPGDSFWAQLHNTGSQLWLDTGDMDAIDKLWTAEFTALTTNNTLLNKEVQKGLYDHLIAKSSTMFSDLPPKRRIIEVAFILNAWHAMRLARRYNANVSVELHTDAAFDIEATLHYARRFYHIDPRHFIIKVPLTPHGLISPRQLREENIPVNFTLGFSARQNFIATSFAKPSFVNVFLGRLNAYVAENDLGDGSMIGEKATVESQKIVSETARSTGAQTRQIAASMRESRQVALLAGIDVLTMASKVALDARNSFSGVWESCRNKNFYAAISKDIPSQQVRIEKLWDISGAEKKFAEAINDSLPRSPEELVESAHAAGVHDLFLRLDEDQQRAIADDGKIPSHKRWQDYIAKGEAAIDSLLNAAGLASFTADQAKLDARIEDVIGKQ
jgi:transaldolase